jgi:methylated-DNA-[protein]-cysteine S-methyltransferase
MKRYVHKTMQSPVGRLKLIGSGAGLAAILWDADERKGRVRIDPGEEHQTHPVLRKAETQLNEYFTGKRKTFSLKLDLIGTAFQKKVWRALLNIPFGETRTYAEIAKQIGRPSAARAVGAANGKNPISIIAPCHRLVGSTGALHGFAGGLATKAKLLRMEADRR